MMTSLPAVPELFRRAWNRFWARAGTLLIVSAGLAAVSLAASSLIVGWPSIKASLGLEPIADIAEVDWNRIMVGRFLLASLLTGLLNIIGTGLMIALLDPERASLWNAARTIRPVLLPLIGVSVLTGLAILAGTLLFIVPGLIVGVMLVFTDFAVVVERRGVRDALRRSRALSEGRRWALFGRLLAYFVVAALLSVIVQNAPLGPLAADLFLPPLGLAFIFELYQAARASDVTA